MSIKIAVVEDEDKCAEIIEKYIVRYESESGQRFEVSRFTDGNALLESYKAVYDIIFMDIKMPITDGMTAAEHIRKKDKNVILIFITNMAQYAIKGYSVDALDFLLKPVPYFAFSRQLKRSIERLSTAKDEAILLNCDGSVIKTNISEILYVESFKHKLLIHTRENSYAISGTMRDFEQRLSDKHFFRCNSCYLVNLSCIKSVNDNSVLIDGGGVSLIISRPRKKAFMEALAGYVGKRTFKV